MRNDGAKGSDENAIGSFVEKFALALTHEGLQRMPARVFAALLATPKGRLTAAELAETLQISPAAVSGAVRYLTQVGMIHRGREPGARRDHFSIGDDQWYEIVGKKDNAYLRLADVLDEGVAAVGTGTDAAERIAETRDFFEFLAKEMPLLVQRFADERRAADGARRAAGKRSGSE